MEAEGDEPALEQLVAWCQHGSDQARVADVIVEEGELEGYSDFEARR